MPRPLQNLPTFHDKITGHNRYFVSGPITGMPDDYRIYGTEQMPLVEYLFDGLVLIETRLSAQVRDKINANLCVLEKHQAYLEELIAVSRVPPEWVLKYETPETGARPIDWNLTCSGRVPILLEVKYRQKALIDHLEQIVPDLSRGRSVQAVRLPDPEWLFRDVVGKFKACDPKTAWQGAWIHAGIKHSREALEKCFQKLDQEKIHFLVLANRQRQAHILSRVEISWDVLCDALGVHESTEMIVE